MARDENKSTDPQPIGTPHRDAAPDPSSLRRESTPKDRTPATLDQDEWHLGGTDTGLEPDFGGVGTDPNYRGGSWVDQRGTRRAEPYAPPGEPRPDEAVAEEARRRLTSLGALEAKAIEVTVSRGEVTLTGWVDDGDQKVAAGDVVDAVPGVVTVHNQLRIRPGPALSATAPALDRDDD
jgi:hypothetical protein